MARFRKRMGRKMGKNTKINKVNFIKKYAIVDLHLHLDGSLSKKAILKVAKHDKIKLQKDFCLKVPKNCASLNEYLKCFEVPNFALQSKFGLKTCAKDLLKRLAKNGIKYAEIRMAPQLSCQKELKQEKVVQTLLKSFKKCEKYGIYANLILCMMRGNDTHEANKITANVAKKFLGRGVVAVDLAGAEGLFKNELFETELSLVRDLGVPLLIHAGEASGAESVKSALKYEPKRIGHGIKSASDEKLLKTLKKRKICLEICPKSNLDTKTILNLAHLPIKKFLDFGVKFTINTDNMSVSNTNLYKEYKRIYKLGFDEKFLKNCAKNAIIYSFANKKLKKSLLALLDF